jgi:hypothetical protein
MIYVWFDRASEGVILSAAKNPQRPRSIDARSGSGPDFRLDYGRFFMLHAASGFLAPLGMTFSENKET